MKHHDNCNKTDAEYCACCGRKITGQGVWLELNSHTGEYRNGAMPEFPIEQSQGSFVFGKTCAAKVLRKQRAKQLV